MSKANPNNRQLDFLVIPPQMKEERFMTFLWR
jgi:hypothetical protein